MTFDGERVFFRAQTKKPRRLPGGGVKNGYVIDTILCDLPMELVPCDIGMLRVEGDKISGRTVSDGNLNSNC